MRCIHPSEDCRWERWNRTAFLPVETWAPDRLQNHLQCCRRNCAGRKDLDLKPPGPENSVPRIPKAFPDVALSQLPIRADWQSAIQGNGRSHGPLCEEFRRTRWLRQRAARLAREDPGLGRQSTSSTASWGVNRFPGSLGFVTTLREAATVCQGNPIGTPLEKICSIQARALA